MPLVSAKRSWGDAGEGAEAAGGKHPPASRLPLYLLGFLAFGLIGLVQAAYGPSFGLLRREYGVSLAQVAWISGLHFFGTACGQLVLGMWLRRSRSGGSLRGPMALGSALMLAGLLGVALSPLWSLVLASALLIGLGLGLLSVGFNIAFAELGVGPANLVNGVFGLGSVASPLVVALLAHGTHAPPFLLMAFLAGLLMLGMGALRSRRPQDQSGELPTALPGLTRVFALCFFLYVAVEAGLGSWATSYLRERGLPHPEFTTSLYWAALTLGRFVSAFAGSRLSPFPVLVAGTGGAMLGSGLLLWPALAPAGLVLTGFSIGPIFATQLAWFTRRLPAVRAPVALTAGSLGGAASPALLGLLASRLGVQTIPLAVLGIASLLLLSLLAARRLERRAAELS